MLQTHQIIPPLSAQTPAGRTVRAWDYKQKKNLVIAFLHAHCTPCAEFLAKLVDRAPALAERNAVALMVFSEPPPPVLAERAPAEVIVARDSSGRSQRAYLGEDPFGTAGQRLLGVFVADRYGELYVRWVVRNEDDLPDVGEVLSWLGEIEVACEECGVSHWPVES